MPTYKEMTDKQIEYFKTKRNGQDLFAKLWVENGTFYLFQSTNESDVGGTTPVPPTSYNPADLRKWPIKFQDNFDLPTPDLTKWELEMPWDSPNNGGNGEKQMYDPSCIQIQNGQCNVFGIKPSKPLPHWATGNQLYPYVSGFMHTHGKYDFTYGYIESTIAVPTGKGVWAAFWTIPSTLEWTSEIDIFECIGEKNKIYINLHYQENGQMVNESVPVTVDDVTKPHRYGCLWQKDLIIYYVDDKEVTRKTKGVPNESHYLVGNVALGGNWPGDPDNTTPFPVKMVINDITVRQKA